MTVCSFKGGVGKTTTAVHLAEYLQANASTLLVDGDANRSALQWAKSGELGFQVCTKGEGIKFSREYDHTVIDTEARPELKDFLELASGCDLMVIPTTPDALSIGAMVQMLDHLSETAFKILLTIVPPFPSRRGIEAREVIAAEGLPIFASNVRQLDAFKKAAEQGKPVHKVAGDRNSGIAWQCYRKIGAEVLSYAQ